MSRISNKFKILRQKKRKALITFITAGDPNIPTTKKLIFALEKGGADIIELGVPFSDPMADGPVIQKASERALNKGVTLSKILRLVREVRKTTEIPILLMGYYNPILAYGLKRFATDAARSGIDAALVVDLPPEVAGSLKRELKRKKIDLIFLLAPTSTPERIQKVCRKGSGFIYFVSVTGITGARLKGPNEIQKKIREIRRKTDLPIAIGFGIRTPSDARKISRLADGVVIGSEIVRRIATSKQPAQVVQRFVHSIRKVI
ncbi:MAG: tryptophan synthase subunit alpha [Deltaproteobacteria bacterium]|nr:tryptophan synthase subunit alpha [Deltaproteobacteria bacterium]